jgi:tetratricopeptide (TPR) repeat protein
MRRLLVILCAFWAAWLVLVGCSKAPGEREFEAGIRELKDGNNVRAKALFEKSINKRPGSDANAMAFNYIGIASWRLGQLQQALDAFEDSRRITPALVEPVYNEGFVLAQSGNPVRAAELLTEAARMDPTDPRPLEVLGQLYTSRGQWPEARRALYGALDRTPNSARILTAIGVVELGDSGPEKAIPHFMKALDKNARYAPALFNLAVIYDQHTPDPAKARAYYEKFVDTARKDPRVDEARAALKRLRGEPAEVAATAAASAPAQPPAAAASRTPVPVAPVKRPPTTVEEILKEASVLAEKGRSGEALDMCLDAAEKAGAAGNAALQEKALRVAVKICFDQPQAHTALGDFLFDAGKNEAALKAYKQATVLDAKYTPAQVGMARAARKAGEIDTALVGVKEAVKNDPGNADAAWLLAEIYDKDLGRSELAAKAYRDFAAQFGSDPRAAAGLARGQELQPRITSTVEPVITATSTPAVVVEAPGDDRPPVVENVRTVPVKPGTAIKYRKPAARNTKAAVQAFNQGAKYQERKDWDRAIYYYLRSLENDDMIASTFYNLGVAYTMKGEREVAKEAYLRALELQPDMANARYNLALIYRDVADFASATRLLEGLVRAQPNHAASHYVLGLIYGESAATYPQAKQHYAKFLELAPNDPAARSAKQWLDAH